MNLVEMELIESIEALLHKVIERGEYDTDSYVIINLEKIIGNARLEYAKELDDTIKRL